MTKANAAIHTDRLYIPIRIPIQGPPLPCSLLGQKLARACLKPSKHHCGSKGVTIARGRAMVSAAHAKAGTASLAARLVFPLLDRQKTVHGQLFEGLALPI